MSSAARRPVGTPAVICLDIGGTSIRASAVTLNSQPMVTQRLRVETLAHQEGPAVLRRAVDLAADVHRYVPEAIGVAVASAGVISPGTGTVTSATELMPRWAGTEISRAVEYRLGLACTVLNDVHAHGLGEFTYGQGVGSSSALIVAAGTGLGGALVNDQELLRGSSGHAGHIGHVHHAAAEGLLCTCGRTGHLESIASGSGMAEQYANTRNSQDPVAAGGAAVVEHAGSGIAAAERVVHTAGRSLGESLGSLANAWDPERIILSGSVSGAGDVWWRHMLEGYRASAMDALQDRSLLRGALGDDAPLLGAAVDHFATRN